MAAIITGHTVADLVRSKFGLVEFPETATVGEAIDALLREDLVAAPIYSTVPLIAAALGSPARPILALPDDSDALSLTAAAYKAYIGTVTVADLLLHESGGEGGGEREGDVGGGHVRVEDASGAAGAGE
ncbi:hypothetical protein CLOP_g19658 [Closterium sp. NIES-67]|nr:hypothetical protein CLOP_g19658 [Closterium sp. NIES-67]